MNRKRSRTAVLVAAGMALAAAGAARANNLQITNVTVTGRDDTTAYVQFDISWENSWRDTNINHDAAWVFFKVLPDLRSAWEHVTLEGTGTNPTDYVVGIGTPIEMIVPDDRVGMFVRRSGEGAGTTSVQNVKAVWNIASNSLVKSDMVKIQAFGVEMVYAAEGDFAVGSGGTGVNEFTLTTINTADTTVAPSGTGSKGGQGGGYPTGQGWRAPNAIWPNGYAAFYCMKYEITQGQYADFLNALTRAQQATRCTATTLNYYMSQTAGGSASIWKRNTVQLTSDPGGSEPRVYTTTRRDRACNGLSWDDGSAFADWAGLRPMTELEYEKACRGPLTPVADEYAWGADTIMPIGPLTISGTEDGTETITDATTLGGCTYGRKAYSGGDGGEGPLRVGIFATASSTRVPAGASYWGIMELSGNVWERTVSMGRTDSLARWHLFTGLHGNGVLTSDGDADVSNWLPTVDGRGCRGGNYYHSSDLARVSDRSWAAVDGGRDASLGSRAVRTAPSGVGR